MRRATLLIVAVLALCFSEHKATAQFYKPIVRLMGTVTENDKPIVARVSVRDAADTTQEIAGSNSNSATGKYLVIIKPEQNYVVIVRADSLVTQSVKISTPATDHNTEIVQNFTMHRAEAAHKKTAKAPAKKKSRKKRK